MRRLLVAGNWKMNGSEAMVRELVEGILDRSAADGAADLAVFPPFPYLAQVRTLADGTHLSWGGQTLNPEPRGAHTGEVSGEMLSDLGCRYVLVGHSERRALYGESDADVAQRFVAAMRHGLSPVLCVGETLEEREAGATENVIARQLDAVLQATGVAPFAQAVVAYEPVWAIGTGRTASPDQAQAVHRFIRDKIVAADATIGGQLRILYGGSVKGGNAAELFSQDDVDGGLVGGASLTAEDFLAIYAATG